MEKTFNKKIKRSGIVIKGALFLLFLTGYLTPSLAQRQPVTVQTTLIPPYSVYLHEYFSGTKNKLGATLIFNDFNESYWDVKLQLKIESKDVSIRTNPNFNPVTPIRLTPGAPKILNATDLAPYFNYNNLIYEGISRGEIEKNGRLPEGFYQFCFEVLDFRTGKKLSNTSCASAWVRISDPPLIQLPQCGNIIKPANPQNLMFQWQLREATPNVNIGYRLEIFEITDPNVNPENAIANNKVLQIYNSPVQQMTSLLYGAGAPPLETGKKYAFRVKAEDKSNSTLFKNDGYSRVCWFNYGYPTGGIINLTSPENGKYFKKSDVPYFQWDAPDNLTIGQQVKYTLKIVKINDNQSPEEALKLNNPWHTETTVSTTSPNGWSLNLTKKLDPQAKYAWNVRATTGEQVVANSMAGTFTGPPLIEKFKAGNVEVVVLETSNDDLSNLTGKGQIDFGNDGSKLTLNFEGIALEEVVGNYVLNEGEIISPVSMNRIELSPGNKENGSAWFVPEEVKLNKENLLLTGKIHWPLPHATNSGSRPELVTAKTSFNFSNYKLNGTGNLSSVEIFNLMEPSGFQLEIDTSSGILVKNNTYFLDFAGKFNLPPSILNTGNGNYTIPFAKADQLTYFVSNNELEEKIIAVDSTKILIKPKNYVIDLSEEKSPGSFEGDNFWKGFYLTDFTISHPVNFDESSQLKLETALFFDLQSSSANNVNGWVDARGLSLKFSKTFNNGELLYFNSFKGELTKIAVEIENGNVKNSSYGGWIQLPFLSYSTRYNYSVELSNKGFNPGYFDEDLANTSFTFNAENERQQIIFTIKKAFFEHNLRLNMTVDINWPYLSATLKNTPNFHLYGGGSVGFSEPGGKLTLNKQVKGKLEEFDIRVYEVGAVFENGTYAVGTGIELIISPELSGEGGKPVTSQLFSISPLQADGDLIASAEKQDNLLATGKLSVGSFEYGGGQNKAKLKLPLNFTVGDGKRPTIKEMVVSMKSPLASIDGTLRATFGDEEWGNSFQGFLNGELYVPHYVKMRVFALFGQKGETDYFFLEMGGEFISGDKDPSTSSKSASKTPQTRKRANAVFEPAPEGRKRANAVFEPPTETRKRSNAVFGEENRPKVSKKMDTKKKPEKLEAGIPIGPILITGLYGRVYHNMNHKKPGKVNQGNTASEFTFEVDPKTEYGAYLRVIGQDRETSGEAFAFDGAIEASGSNGKLVTFGLDAKVFIGSDGNPNQQGGVPAKSDIMGAVVITVNTVKETYYGSGEVILKRNTRMPPLCGGGFLEVAVEPGKWKVSVGNREKRIYIYPKCAPKGFHGWVSVSHDTIDAGFGIGFKGEGNSGDIGIAEVCEVKFIARGEFAGGGRIIIPYKENLPLPAIGIWADAKLEIFVEYDCLVNSGSFTLVSIALKGDLLLYIKEKRIKGDIKGNVTVIGIGVDFNLGFDVNI